MEQTPLESEKDPMTSMPSQATKFQPGTRRPQGSSGASEFARWQLGELHAGAGRFGFMSSRCIYWVAVEFNLDYLNVDV